MPAGRPRLIDSPADFQRMADAYFREIDADENKHPTLTGLVLALGLGGWESLDEYGRRAEFSGAVSRAKMRVAEGYEQATVGRGSPQGAMFILRNIRSGEDSKSYFTEKQEIEHSGSIQTGIEAALDAARQQLEKEPEEPEQTD